MKGRISDGGCLIFRYHTLSQICSIYVVEHSQAWVDERQNFLFSKEKHLHAVVVELIAWIPPEEKKTYFQCFFLLVMEYMVILSGSQTEKARVDPIP